MALVSGYEYIPIDVQEKKDAAYTCFFACTLYAGLTGLCLMFLYTDSKVVEPETFELNSLNKPYDDEEMENEEFPLMRG